MAPTYEWRGDVTSRELNGLHAEAFGTRVYEDHEWDWRELLRRHSLGWVVAREDDGERGSGSTGSGGRGSSGTNGALVGFVNVLWDGLVHAWVQDTMVAGSARGRGIGTRLVAVARDHARDAGCEWLHVDFDEELADFYIGACGFVPARAGLIALQQPAD